MTTESNRPKWAHKEMDEASFRYILNMGRIATVTAKWEMTGADTASEWLEATNTKGETFIMPDGWHKALKFVGHASVPGLFAYTYEAEKMLKNLAEIDAWENRNAEDRRTYERLKAKFGG